MVIYPFSCSDESLTALKIPDEQVLDRAGTSTNLSGPWYDRPVFLNDTFDLEESGIFSNIEPKWCAK